MGNALSGLVNDGDQRLHLLRENRHERYNSVLAQAREIGGENYAGLISSTRIPTGRGEAVRAVEDADLERQVGEKSSQGNSNVA